VNYDYALAARRIAETPMSERPLNIWFLEELLPIHDAVGPARVGEWAGFTPLIRADRLGEAVGLRNLYIKDDSTSRPSLSYKDRVVSMAVARLLELGRKEIGCVSTGNVGTAVAALAAKAGAAAYVFYPNRLESTKAHACRALGARVCQLEANYDEANKACRALAEATGLEFANITLRPFYAEGAKTEAYEIVQQLGWRAPDRIVSPAAGGTTVAVVKKLAAEGRIDPEETIVAVITGNGLKTLYEHPAKPWPSKVECDPETMRGVLEGFQREAGLEPPRARLHA
jgi:threonine synthase